MTDSAKLPLQNLRIFGKSEQNGVPSPDAPAPILSVGEKRNINLSVDEKKIMLSTRNGLFGIKINNGGNYTDKNGQNWVCNEIDLAKGKYIQRIMNKNANELKIIDVGTTDGGRFHGYAASIELYDIDKYIKRIIPSLCNKFNRNGGANSFSYCTVADAGWNGYSRIIFKVPLEYDNVDKLKKLIGDDFEFLYQLKDPIEHDLTEPEIQAFKQLYMNCPTTTVINDENAEMELIYTADTKIYLDNIKKEVMEAIANTNAQLL